MDEKRAILLCLRHQDPMGFEFLVRKYRREAYFHANAIMQNREDAIDACQEAFTRAFKAIPKLSKLDRFYPWFYRILRNYCLNAISRKKTITDGEEKIHDLNDPFYIQTSPEKQMLIEEEKLKIWQTINKLKPEFREILMMKYRENKNYSEISEILNIPRGTVMSRLYHARSAFKEQFILNKNKGGK